MAKSVKCHEIFYLLFRWVSLVIHASCSRNNRTRKPVIINIFKLWIYNIKKQNKNKTSTKNNTYKQYENFQNKTSSNEQINKWLIVQLDILLFLMWKNLLLVPQTLSSQFLLGRSDRFSSTQKWNVLPNNTISKKNPDLILAP